MSPAAEIPAPPDHPLRPGEVYDRKRARIVIHRDDLAFVIDSITGGLLSRFPSAVQALAWGCGIVPVEDLRQPLTAGSPAGARP